MINAALVSHTWRLQRAKLAAVVLGLLVWGFIAPVVYAQFGAQFRVLVENRLIPEQFAQFGGGDIFTLSGSVALAFMHPIALILNAVFAVGFSTAAVAGERQRGTLEVTLSRPISRRGLYAALLTACLTFVAVTTLALMTGCVAGATFEGVRDELNLARLPWLWLNAVLLFSAIAAIGLAASVSFDRYAPALGLTLAIVVISYFFEVLGSLWPAAKPLQPWSLFHYMQPKAILQGTAAAHNGVVLALVFGAAIGYALYVFPRRDLPAPS